MVLYGRHLTWPNLLNFYLVYSQYTYIVLATNQNKANQSVED